MELKIQKFLHATPWEEAAKQLEEWDINFHFEISPISGKEYLHLDYGIKADKTQEITKECRGLVLEKDSWGIQRYALYRFLNFGEMGVDTFDERESIIYEEKADGSLIILSYFEGHGWVAGSRGAIFPSAKVQGYEVTFEDLFWDVCGLTPKEANEIFDKKICYIFELCTLFNRIVIPYEQPYVVFLGARDSSFFGDYGEIRVKGLDLIYDFLSKYLKNIRRPKTFIFSSISECVEKSKDLPGFEEGFVAKQWYEKQHRFKRVKIKGRAYLDLHHVVTSLSLRNLVRLVVFDDRECLETFPEYLEVYDKIESALQQFYNNVFDLYVGAATKVSSIFDEREKRKQFALAVQGPYAGICFSLYDGKEESVHDFIVSLAGRGKSKVKWIIEQNKLDKIAGDKWRTDVDEDADI